MDVLTIALAWFAIGLVVTVILCRRAAEADRMQPSIQHGGPRTAVAGRPAPHSRTAVRFKARASRR